MRKRKMTSGRSQENSFIVITLYSESNCTYRKKIISYSVTVHRRYQNIIYTSLDVMLEKYWRLLERGWRKKSQMHGQDSQDLFYWRKGHRKDIHGPGGDLQGNKNLVVLMMCGQKCGSICLMQQRRKQNNDGQSRNQELDNARQLRGIFFVEPNDEEFKLTVKAARRKLEVPMPAAMPCKIPIKSSGETHRSIGKRKTKYACVVDADESTRPRLEGAGHKPHQDHITAKGTKSMTRYSLAHKFIPMPQALKIPDAKAAMEKQW